MLVAPLAGVGDKIPREQEVTARGERADPPVVGGLP